MRWTFWLAPVEQYRCAGYRTPRASGVFQYLPLGGVRTSAVITPRAAEQQWCLTAVDAASPHVATLRRADGLIELPSGPRRWYDLPYSQRTRIAAGLERRGLVPAWDVRLTCDDVLRAAKHCILAQQRAANPVPGLAPRGPGRRYADDFNRRPPLLLRLAGALNPLAVTYSDDFNRANTSSLGGSWVEDAGNFAIVSNGVRQETAGSSYRKLRYGAAMDTDNYYSQADVTIRASQNPGVFVRGVASSTVTYYGYIFFISDFSYGVEITGGAETLSATGGSTGGSGTSYPAVRLTANGSTLTGTRNGVADLSWSDATLASGQAGIAIYGGNSSEAACVDNWSAVDLSTSVVLPGVDYRDHPKAFLFNQ